MNDFDEPPEMPANFLSLLDETSSEEESSSQRPSSSPPRPSAVPSLNTPSQKNVQDFSLSKPPAGSLLDTPSPRNIEDSSPPRSFAVSSSDTPNRRNTRDSEDDVDEIILSIIWMKGQVGAACYNMSTSVLSVMDDMVEDTFNYSITKSLYMQCQPRHVLTTAGTPEEFRTILKKMIVKDSFEDQNGSSTSSAINIEVLLNILNKNQNNYDHCYQRVKLLKLNSEPEDTSTAERVTFLNSVLNFNSKLMIHALGLLLKYLDENWTKLALNPSEQVEFLYINSITLNNLVMMDEDTYQTLNIMQSKFHPSLFKYGSCSVEDGMNLFTFFNRCQSRPGVQSLWTLMRHPTRDIEQLTQRHAVIEFFMNADNQNIFESIKSSLKQINRLTPAVIKRYKTPQAKPGDWKKLSKTISHLTIIGEICDRYRNTAKLFDKVANSINDDIHRVRYFIDYIIDHDASKQHGRFIVLDGVDPDLDTLNYRKQCLPQLLTEAAEKEMESLPESINALRYIYLPDIGYLAVVTEWNGNPPEDVEIPGLEFKFSANGVRHYKSNGARELDATAGDIAMLITAREKQIMLRLIDCVGKHIGAILKAIDHCAELDATLCLVGVSRDQNYVKPELIMGHILEIRDGRHPLKELSDNYVDNDILSGGKSSLMKIFSGPNACGKSLYMKQVALIVYLAHIGSFVPAKSATIGLVTHILTQMSSVQTNHQDASSYLVDLRQINNIIYSSTPNSLIIMDEFGRGTAEIDSLALLTSILKSFIDRGQACPHVFCATHIHRVAELLPSSPIYETQTFEFILNDDKQVVFLYRLISGKVDTSFAHIVARSVGLPDSMVERAEKVFEYMKKGALPKCNPEEDRRNVLKHLTDLKIKDQQISSQELKQWMQQVFSRKISRK